MSIKLKGSSDGSVSFDAPADTSPSGSDITLVLPTTVGSAEQFLKNSGTAGTLEFSSMVETSTGVGIGTTSPSAKLHAKSGTTDVVADFESTDANAWIQIRDNSTTDTAVMVGAAGDDLRLRAGSNEAARITSAGRLGIGTSAPASLLNISASSGGDTSGLRITRTDSGGGDWRIWSSATANGEGAGKLIFGNSGNRVVIDGSGNVGVGTTSPASKLDLGSDTGVKVTLLQSNYSLGVESNELRIASNQSTTFYSGGHSGTERLRIDSSGRVGIGNSSPSHALHIHDGTGSAAQVAKIDAGGVGLLSIQSGTSSESRIEFGDSSNDDAGYIYYDNSGDVMKFGVNASERLRIDSSGNMLIGHSSAADSNNRLELENTFGGRIGFLRDDTSVTEGNNIGMLSFYGNDSSGVYHTIGQIEIAADGEHSTGSKPTRMIFSTCAASANDKTERMRIEGNGSLRLIAAGTGATFSTTLSTTDSSNAGIEVKASATAGTPDSGTRTFLVNPNGNVKNVNNSYGALSDAKLKENIVDASSQWNDIKDLRVRNYNFIEGQTHTQIGVVAQEVETVSPGLVSESPDRDEEGNDLGTVTKSVNYSVLYMKAVKALQEAIDRIETLETKVAALEAQ